MADVTPSQDRDAQIAREVRRLVVVALAFCGGGGLIALATGWLWQRWNHSSAGVFLVAAFMGGGIWSQSAVSSVLGLNEAREAPSAELWRAALLEIRKAAPPRPGPTKYWPVAMLSLVLFIGALATSNGLTSLILITAVLAFHEGGHLSAMQALGYRDTRILFIPYLGAVTIGKREDSTAAEEAIVLLAGPLPGLVLGVALSLSPFRHEPLVRHLAGTLLLINLFNLLPLAALDGGKLLSLLLFSRSPRLEASFALLSSAVLALVGIALHAWLLTACSLLSVAIAPIAYRISKSARAVRARMVFPEALDTASEDFLRLLFEEAYFRVLSASLVYRNGPRLAATCAGTMRQIHARGVERHPGTSA